MPRDHWREFPRELDSFGQLPGEIFAGLRSHLPPEDSVIHLYSIPQQRGFWEWFHDLPPRNSVFCLTPTEILIAREERDKTVVVKCIKIDDIATFQVGTVLLRSWLSLTVMNQGQTEDVTLPYGTVFGRQFRDAILWLRALMHTSSDTPRHVWRMPGEEHIKALPLKFNNAARAYWLANESALASCFIEPLTSTSAVLRLIRRPYAEATAIVLSNQSICVVREQAASGAGRWGQVWHFCSIDHIIETDIVELEKFPEMRLRLATLPPRRSRNDCQMQHSATTLAIPFDPQQSSDIERLVSMLDNHRSHSKSRQDRRGIRENV